MIMTPLVCLVALAAAPSSSHSQPDHHADAYLPTSSRQVWGFSHGIRLAIFPNAISGPGDGGPRGLLRIGYPILPDGGSNLINFIAVEPTVNGRKGFSELERSADGNPGKVIQFTGARREKIGKGPDRLILEFDVERFENGAHVRLEAAFRSDRPNEVKLRAYAEPDSAPMQECVLTATMGNYERLRRIWLKNGSVDSKILYPDYTGDGFASDHFFPLDLLARRKDGSVIAPCAPDEPDPRESQSRLPAGTFWRYPGVRVTQYWRAPRGSFSPDLTLRVNARRVYWGSNLPLPGGIAFENIELRDHFRSGQPFIFGVSTEPAEDLTKDRG